MKNLIREYVKRNFFENKESAIGNYVNTMKGIDISIYQYTSGKNVVIDNVARKAYSRNGYLFEVILKDDDYIQYLEETQKDAILAYLDNVLSERYEEKPEEVEEDEPLNEEEDE